MRFCKEASFPVLSVNFSTRRRRQSLFFSTRISACRSHRPYKFFVNHRGFDTKFNIAASIHDRLDSSRRQSLFFSTKLTACRSRPPYKVFINHCGLDTKRNIAALIHDRLDKLKLQSFLDYKSLKPGEKVEEAIDSAIRECSVGVVIFSPNHCTSEHCLSELALMMELDKVIIPIFFGVKTSDLEIVDDGRFPDEKLQRFRWALEQAKGRSGITLHWCNGDWAVLSSKVEETVVELLKKLEASNETNLLRRLFKIIVNWISIFRHVVSRDVHVYEESSPAFLSLMGLLLPVLWWIFQGVASSDR